MHHFIARLRSFLKCKTILILIQSTSSPLELAMGSWVLRLVDVFPFAAPRKHEHTQRAPTQDAPPARPPTTASVRYGRIHDRNRHATSTVTIYQASSYGRKFPPRDPNGHDICCSITRGNGRTNSPRGPTDHDIRQKQDIQRLS